MLANVRFVLDGSPKNAHYPYHPEKGSTGYTEGWVTFNTPFNTSLAYLARAETKLTLRRDGDALVIRLEAPLNFDYAKVESGKVQLSSSNGDRETVVVTEESPSSRFLTGRITIKSGATPKADDGVLQTSPGGSVEAGYGFGYWGRQVALSLTQTQDRKSRWRIMPVGDSITEGGTTFAVYRAPLLQKLTDAGYHVEYAGSRGSGTLKHEGYGGSNAEFLATVVGKNFQRFPADIVLIHAGHNHFVEEKPLLGIVAATEKMVADFRAANPKVIVLLAQVIPSGKLPKYSYIPELNQELAKLAKRLDVVLVNQADGFDWKSDTIADMVHPNAKGAEKMAACWFTALKPILERQP